LASTFIEELKAAKAIYHDHAPLLISVEEKNQPKGKVVVGYDGFDAVDDLRVNGYFEIKATGFVIHSRPLQANKDRAMAKMSGIAQRLRERLENEIPVEPGNCIENAFLIDG
nr:hypothetical protein [Tanacetum cinerariifolium]